MIAPFPTIRFLFSLCGRINPLVFAAAHLYKNIPLSHSFIFQSFGAIFFALE